MGELIKAYDDYVKLLVAELEEIIVLATAYGWKTTRFGAGKELREKIEMLKGQTSPDANYQPKGVRELIKKWREEISLCESLERKSETRGEGEYADFYANKRILLLKLIEDLEEALSASPQADPVGVDL